MDILDRRVPLTELNNRVAKFRRAMDYKYPDWTMAAVFSKINMYYFAGTMQNGMLLIPRNGEAVLWVLRSYERAREESLFPDIRPMSSYRDAAADYRPGKTIYIEAEVAPLALLGRFGKYFPCERYESMDSVIADVRAVKSEYEISLIRRAGELHRHILEDVVPSVLKEGMSELDLSLELYTLLVKGGHQGFNRLRMFDTEMAVGQLAFGDNSLYPTNFNGPGGSLGMSPAAPFLGSRERLLKPGDLVFIDVACAVDGYNTDKTMTYMFCKKLPEAAIDAHRHCVKIRDRVAGMLKPGAIPADIYRTVLSSLDEDFLKNFMGFGNRRVRFLGHGIGLQIDESPVIAEGFNEPLQKNMLLAIEPKKGIEGIGMVGVEDTYLVESEGAVCVTGGGPGLLFVE